MVLFVYVDNSNVWIEGRRAAAVANGLAESIDTATSEGILDSSWSYDFGRLYELACPPGAKVGRSLLIGSRPPSNDSLWDRARTDGFEVEVFDRNASNREKRVDTALVTTMLDDSYQYMQPSRGDMVVLVAGDGDYIPTVESLQRRGIKVRVVFWSHAVSRDLRNLADEFRSLDEHLDELAHTPALTS